MQSRTGTENVLRFSSIDELLGDSRTRFFGAGFRLVKHQVGDVEVDPRGQTARAVAKIDYPATWSIKKSGDLQPHLSTLDAFTIGAQLCEAYVRTAYGVDGGAADRMWLSRTMLKPSNAPTLDLAAVPASCTLLKTESASDSLCGHLSSFTAKIGSMALEFVIDHPIERLSQETESWGDIAELLGPSERRYFGSGYMATEVVLRDIELFGSGERVRAIMDLVDPPETPPLRGMGAAYAPFVSSANVIVGVAQLAQALMYRYDDISREVSHNLWMRRVVLDSRVPVNMRHGLIAETWSTKMSLLPVKETMWRSGNFALTVPGIIGEYNLAHQLPAGKLARASARPRALEHKERSLMTTRQARSLRLAISGTYSTGKTTTTEALSLWVGLPRTHAQTMREILPEVLPGKALEDCTPSELFQLGILRYTERAVRESGMTGSYVSDGSSLHEWVYGKARMVVGINPNDGPIQRTIRAARLLPAKRVISDINEAFGAVVKRHAKKAYDEFIHLPVEFPLVKDGHRPVSEEFRALSDRLLVQILTELGITFHVVSGTIEERLTKIAAIYGLEPVMPLEQAVTEARVRVQELHKLIETDAQAAALRRQTMPWHQRVLHRLAS
jgi:hypothetical protein